MVPFRDSLTFLGKMSPPSSGIKSKPRKEQAEAGVVVVLLYSTMKITLTKFNILETFLYNTTFIESTLSAIRIAATSKVHIANIVTFHTFTTTKLP
jgi:hypothetical protein